MSMRAVWKGVVLAESDDTVVVEGNHYFPRQSLNEEHFSHSDLRVAFGGGVDVTSVGSGDSTAGIS